MVAEDSKGVMKPAICVKGVGVTGWWVGVTGSYKKYSMAAGRQKLHLACGFID